MIFGTLVLKRLSDGQITVLISELTDFDWDTVCVLPPYTVGIQKRRGNADTLLPPNIEFDPNNLPEYNEDGLWAFAFVRDNKLVAIEKRNRGPGLKIEYQSNCIPSEHARFEKLSNSKHNILLIKDGEMK